MKIIGLKGLIEVRETLKNRRPSITTSFWHNGFDYVTTIGFYEDGRVGEVFLSCAKNGTDLNTNMRDAAIAVSFALQHGATVQSMKEAMLRDESGIPQGTMGILLDLLDEQEVLMKAQVKEWIIEHERLPSVDDSGSGETSESTDSTK